MNLPTISRLTLLGLVVLGCSMAPGGAPTATPVTATPTAPPAQATATPTQATATLPLEPTPTTARSTPGTFSEPPAGFLTFEDTTVEGWLGSWCLPGRCVDKAEPTLEGLPVLEAPGDTLTFKLAGDAPFVAYTAAYGIVSADSTVIKREGEFDPDAGIVSPPMTSAEFSTPPSGEWMVTVFVQFGPGDALYVWKVSVE
jgi:hypothetical protein